MQCMHSLPQYSNLGYIHLVGRCMLSLKCYSTTLVLPLNQTFIILLNPSTIDEHGEWCLKKVEPQDKQSRLRRVSMTTCEQEPLGTVTLNISENYKILTTYTYHAKRDGQEKSGCKYVSPWHIACKPRPPHIPILGGKLLANIVSCLTYPKLHLQPH